MKESLHDKLSSVCSCHCWTLSSCKKSYCPYYSCIISESISESSMSSLQFNFLSTLCKMPVSKCNDDTHVDEERYRKRNHCFNWKIKVCFSNVLSISSIYFSWKQFNFLSCWWRKIHQCWVMTTLMLMKKDTESEIIASIEK